jgi:hypothetical protein
MDSTWTVFLSRADQRQFDSYREAHDCACDILDRHEGRSLTMDITDRVIYVIFRNVDGGNF